MRLHLVLPEPRSVAFHENEFDLYDTQDQAFRKLVNGWRVTEEGLRIQVTFTAESSSAEPKVLREGSLTAGEVLATWAGGT